MLPKKNRLKKENDFKEVLRTGKKIREGFLILKAVKNNTGQTRFGISISKKVSKKATVRNKIRRRLAGLCGAYLPKLKNELDIIVLVLPGMETKSFLEIKEMLKNIFSKAKIINNG